MSHTTNTRELAKGLRRWAQATFNTDIGSSGAHRALAAILGERNQHTMAAKGSNVVLDAAQSDETISAVALWLRKMLESGVSDSAIAASLNSSDALTEVGHMVETADLVRACRELSTTSSPQPADGVTTTVILRDDDGIEVETRTFEDSSSAGRFVARFIDRSADASWASDGAARPGPAKYTLEVSYDRQEGERALPSAAHPTAVASGVNQEALSEIGKTLLSTEIVPWQVWEGETDAADGPRHLTANWPVSIKRAGYGGLSMTATRPDGTACELIAEVADGHLVLYASSDPDGEWDAKICITQDAAHVSSPTDKFAVLRYGFDQATLEHSVTREEPRPARERHPFTVSFRSGEGRQIQTFGCVAADAAEARYQFLKAYGPGYEIFDAKQD